MPKKSSYRKNLNEHHPPTTTTLLQEIPTSLPINHKQFLFGCFFGVSFVYEITTGFFWQDFIHGAKAGYKNYYCG